MGQPSDEELVGYPLESGHMAAVIGQVCCSLVLP